MKAILKTPQKRTAQMKKVIIKQYPELENLEVTPTSEEQVFKSEKYGYGEVKVKGVESEEITIVPSANEQIREGFFNKVTVEGDEDLKPSNIRRGTTLFGVEGEMDGRGEENAVIDIYVTNKRIIHHITKIESLDLTGWTSCENLLYECDALVEMPNITGTENVTNGKSMFHYCNGMRIAKSFDTSKMTTMESFFAYCGQLTEIPEYDCSSNTSLHSFCNECRNLVTVPDMLTTGKVTRFSQMFRYNEKLVNAPRLNTSSGQTFSGMYYRCGELKTIPEYDFSSANDIYDFIYNCGKIEEIGGFLNLGKAYTRTSENYDRYTLSLTTVVNLTYESLLNICNKVYDLNLTYNVANGGTLYRQKIKFGATNLAKLQATDEGQQALANLTAKGWNYE